MHGRSSLTITIELYSYFIKMVTHPLFWKLCIYSSVYMIINYNPTVLLVSLILSKLKHIDSVAILVSVNVFNIQMCKCEKNDHDKSNGNFLSRQTSKTKFTNQLDFFAHKVIFFGTNCLIRSKTAIL